MTLRGALLSFRIQRFETTIVVGAAILSVAVSTLVIWLYNSPSFARCLVDDQSSFNSVCQTGIFPWLSKVARLSAGIVPIFPVVAGLASPGPSGRPGSAGSSSGRARSCSWSPSRGWRSASRRRP